MQSSTGIVAGKLGSWFATHALRTLGLNVTCDSNDYRNRIPASQPPYAKTSPATTRRHRVADLPAALAAVPPAVPSMVPACQPSAVSPCRHKLQTRFPRSKQRLLPEEPWRRDEMKRGGPISPRSDATCRRSGQRISAATEGRRRTLAQCGRYCPGS